MDDDMTADPIDLSAYLRACVMVVLKNSTFWLKEHSEDAAREVAATETRANILDACEAFRAAKAIWGRYKGPAILLYSAAVNALATGSDTELAAQVESARGKVKAAGLWKGEENADVRAALEAASAKASFERVGRFMREEFARGLVRADMQQAEARKLARKIVDASHDVRHRARVDQRTSTLLVKDSEGFKMVPEGQTMPRFAGPVRLMVPVPTSEFFKLVSAARIGCANAIASRIHAAKAE